MRRRTQSLLANICALVLMYRQAVHDREERSEFEVAQPGTQEMHVDSTQEVRVGGTQRKCEYGIQV